VPLNDSLYPFYQGLPGSMNKGCSPNRLPAIIPEQSANSPITVLGSSGTLNLNMYPEGLWYMVRVRNRKAHLVFLLVAILWITRVDKDGLSCWELVTVLNNIKQLVEAAGVEPVAHPITESVN